MREITFDTLESAISAVKGFADGSDCNVPIMAEEDGTFMFFGHGTKVATWICGDMEDDLLFHGITREPNPTPGYLVTTTP